MINVPGDAFKDNLELRIPDADSKCMSDALYFAVLNDKTAASNELVNAGLVKLIAQSLK